jgi:hypothetical protein
MPTDRIQHQFEVGDVVNIPIRVTAVGGTTAAPTVTGTTVYAGFDGNTDTVTTLDAIQVVLDQMVGPRR